ncbi:MAG: PDZ domain-containing protein [Bdellovibrionota bacterium]
MQTAGPHSLYIAESNVDEMKKQDKNIATGIGIEPKYTHRAIRSAMPIDTVIIDYVYPNTPADQKLKIDDEIEQINGQPLNSKYFTEVASIIAENPASIDVKVKRLENALTLTQKEIQKPALYSRTANYNGKTMKWIRMTRFVMGVSKQFERELKVAARKYRRIIFGPARKSGGLVDEGVNVFENASAKTR